MQIPTERKPLNFFSISMMNVVMVASLQMMTACAVYGSSLLIFYLIAFCFFFVPTLLIIAELVTASPTNGGSYIWVERAFGKHWGFFAACIQWLSNLIWYPTIFSFITTCFAYLFFPDLAEQKYYLFISMLIIFWGITLLNFFGIKISSLISSISAIIGVILPTLLLVALGIAWLAKSNPVQMQFSWSSMIPRLDDPSQFAFLTQVVISLVGLEMAFVHAGDIHDPQRAIPKALKFSAIAVLMIVIAAPLSIATVIASDHISIVAGLFDAFKIFFEQCELPFSIYLVMLGLIFVGNCGHVSSWMISATRSMHVASQKCTMPPFFQKTNRFHAPLGILILEAIIFSIVSAFFLFFETINNAYWILLLLASQMTLIYYLLLFSAAVKIKQNPSYSSTFKIPGGVKGTKIAALFAGTTTVAVIIFGFFPPEQGMVLGGRSYPFIIAVSILAVLCIPFALLRLGQISYSNLNEYNQTNNKYQK